MVPGGGEESVCVGMGFREGGGASVADGRGLEIVRRVVSVGVCVADDAGLVICA